ncbi:MAG: hypothetical protein ABMB14_30350 [Myxococcota bacterium]
MIAHIQQEERENSGFVSTTARLDIAIDKFGRLGVIVIDRGELHDAGAQVWGPEEISDVTTAHGEPEAAVMSLDEEEHLVERRIPQGAITFYIPPR